MSLEAADDALVELLSTWPAAAGPGGRGPVDPGVADDLARLFDAQVLSRHVDLAARALQQRGQGFYTIASAGHESDAVVALATRPTDPALLHYRSGAFYAARAAQAGGDATADLVRSLTGDRGDPSGGRHKVFGSAALSIVPTTSTIASHLPRAVGLAFGLDRGRRLGVDTGRPRDAIVVASLGDASVNHSTALGAFNAAGHATHQGLPVPLLLVCEDNGLGISVPTPAGWTARVLAGLPGIDHAEADGTEPVAALATARRLAEQVRRTRRPAVLHLRVVRIGGHAGSDAELAYRSPAAIAADLERDPLRATAAALVAAGEEPGALRYRYERARAAVAAAVERTTPARPLTTAAEVMAPLATYATPAPLAPGRDRAERFGGRLPEEAGDLTLAQALNAALTDLLAADPGAIAFGEDVGAKGGVYGVTRGLAKRFGRARVFDTLLDEQTVLGLGLGTALSGMLPVPEIQYLAYLHNAEDQLRGEAATLAFFSDGAYRNPMVVRVPGLAYQKGFGGHFHNDNALGVLRDVPGLVVACPSGAATAPGLLRALAGIARADGRPCVLLEPIARYHDAEVAAAYDAPDRWAATTPALGEVRLEGDGGDVLVVTFGNGVAMSRRAVARAGVAATVLDLQWLVPLPVAAVVEAARGFPRVLVVDETRRSGGVSEGVVTALVDHGYPGTVRRVTSQDSVIPLGPAAATVLLGEDEVVGALSVPERR